MSYFAPGMMYLSIQIEAIDDQITEDVEVFEVIVEAVNPLDSVSSRNSSTVYILDNDGNKIKSRELILNFSPIFLPCMHVFLLGEDVILPEFVSAIEGTTFQVCATVSAIYPTHERDIILTFTLTPESDFASKFMQDCNRMGTWYVSISVNRLSWN